MRNKTWAEELIVFENRLRNLEHEWATVKGALHLMADTVNCGGEKTCHTGGYCEGEKVTVSVALKALMDHLGLELLRREVNGTEEIWVAPVEKEDAAHG